MQGIHQWTALILGREVEESRHVAGIVLFVKLWKELVLAYACVTTPEPDPTRLGLADPNRNPGDARLILFFYLHFYFVFFFFQKCRDPNPRLDLKGRSEPEPGLLRHFFLFILSKHLLMSFCFKVFNFAEAFSNGRPINIHISQNTITMMAFYAFLK